jgi:hypothetical protein
MSMIFNRIYEYTDPGYNICKLDWDFIKDFHNLFCVRIQKNVSIYIYILVSPDKVQI